MLGVTGAWVCRVLKAVPLGAVLIVIMIAVFVRGAGPASAQSGGAIEGTVVDAETGEPIVGVRVDAFMYENPFGTAYTDESGSYAIESLNAGTYTVLFAPTASGHASQWFDNADTPTTATAVLVGPGERLVIDQELQPALSISGSVTGSDGMPLAEIYVRLLSEAGQPVGFGYTDPNGDYFIGGLDPGTYRLYFTSYSQAAVSEWYDDAPDSESATPLVLLEDGDLDNIDAELDIRGQIEGTITTADGGVPADRFYVSVYDQATTNYVRRAYTDVSGNFRITNLAAGSYVLHLSSWAGVYISEYYASAPSFEAAEAVVVPENGIATVSPVARRAASISGVISGASNNPIAGALVDAYDANGSRVRSVRTDTSGNYRLQAMADGAYRLNFLPPNDLFSRYHPTWYDDALDIESASEVVVGEAEDATVNGSLVSAGLITGTLTQTGGSPAAGAAVSVYDGDFNRLMRVVAAADGTYELGPLSSGDYRVYFGDESGRNHPYVGEYFDRTPSLTTATPVAVVDGQETIGIDAELARWASISGRIVDTDGNPIRSIWVTADQAGIYTDANGFYHLDGIRPGSHRVWARDTQGRFINEYYDNVANYGEATPITVQAGSEVASIDFDLARGGSIRGTVTGADGQPIASGLVRVLDTSGGSVTAVSISASGTFVASQLLAGDYLLRAEEYNGTHLDTYYGDVTALSSATVISLADGAVINGADTQMVAGSTGGVVRDGDGAPLAGIDVSVYNAINPWPFSYRTTNSEGRFTLDLPSDGQYFLRFSGDGSSFATEWYDDVHEPTESTRRDLFTPLDYAVGDNIDLVIVLEPRSTVSGTITDEAGQPVGGVDVWYYGDDSDDFDQVVTDESGTYTFPAVDIGTYLVEVNYTPETIGQAVAEDLVVGYDQTITGVDAQVANYGSISGVVTNDDGEPLAGIQVGRRGDAVTDAEGRYRLTGLLTGDHRLQFIDPAEVYEPLWYESATEQAAATLIPVAVGQETTGIDMTMRTGAKISGTVTDAEGNSLSDIRVNVRNQQTYRTGVTTDDGTYSVGGLPSGLYEVSFSDPSGRHEFQYYLGHTNRSDADLVDVTIGETVSGINAALRAYTIIRGTVTDESGQPITDVSVWTENVTGCCGRSATTDSEGHYEIIGVSATQVKVVADAGTETLARQWWDGKTLASRANVLDGGYGVVHSNIDFVLVAGGEIVGTVTDDGGGPLASVSVYAYDADGSVVRSTNVDVAGRYVLRGLNAGDYRLRFSRHQHVTEFHDDAPDLDSATPITVESGGFVVVNAALSPFGSITGQVTTSDGAAIVNARVTANQPGSQGSPVSRRVAYTDTNGVYSLPNLADGNYFVLFDHANYSAEWFDDVQLASQASPVTVTSTGVTDGVDAELVPAGALRGTVTTSDGEPLAGIRLTAQPATGGARGAVSDEDGTYAFAGLEVGDYRLLASDPQGRFFDEWFEDATTIGGATVLAIGSGSDVVADLTLDQSAGRVTGRVVDEFGTAVPSATVRLWSGRSSRDSVSSGADGTYRFGLLSAGDYQVSVERAGYATTWYEAATMRGEATTIEVGLGETAADVDVVLPDRATISGVVLNEAGSRLSSIRVRAIVPDDGQRHAATVYTDELGRFTMEPDTLADVIILVGDGSYGYFSEYYPDTEDPAEATRFELSPGANIDGLLATISDNRRPIVSFAVNPAQGAAPLSTTFAISVTDPDGDPIQWSLNFGDGQSINGTGTPPATVEHTYQDARYYTAILTVNDGSNLIRRHLNVDSVVPQDLAAVAGSDRRGEAGSPMIFRSTGSAPESYIDRFQWDFGDGTTADGAQVSHTFADAGTYDVTLTVHLGDETASDSATVTVVPDGEGTGLTVNVTDNNGAALAGAMTEVVLSEDTRVTADTDVNGQAQLVGLDDGTYSLAVAALGYVPVSVPAVVQSGSGSVDVQLTSGSLGSATLTTEPATAEDLDAAGLDPNDPANQNIVTFEVLIDEIPYRIVRTTGGSFYSTQSGVDCVGTSCPISASSAGDTNSTTSITFSDSGEQAVLMQVPIRTQWLKEFYNVELTVINNATDPFRFESGTAILDLPSGLSLAPIGSQTLEVTFDDVPPEGKRSHTWLVRGDEPGEYDVSATYRGLLQPTGLPVTLRAETTEPLKVWGTDGVRFIIETDENLERLAPYRIRVGMENISDAPILYPKVSLAPADLENGYVYQPGQRMEFAVEAIQPGETFWTDAIDKIVVVQPDASVFSYRGRVNVDIKGLQDVEFEQRTQTNAQIYEIDAEPTETDIRFDWAPVPGSEGYRVHRLDDGLTGFGPALTELDPATTEATLTDFDPESDAIYAVSTRLDGSWTMVHRSVESSSYLDCGADGHHEDMVFWGPTGPVTRCSVFEGPMTVEWGGVGAGILDFEVVHDGTPVECVVKAQDEAGTRIECVIEPLSLDGTELVVTATDDLGSTSVTYTVVPDRDWQQLSTHALNMSEDTRSFFPRAAEALRVEVERLGPDPSDQERAGLFRLILSVNQARSMRPFLEIQFELATKAIAASVSNATSILLADLSDPILKEFVKQRLLIHYFTAYSSAAIISEVSSGISSAATDAVIGQLIDATAEGSAEFLLDEAEVMLDGYLAIVIAQADRYDGPDTRPDARDFTASTDYLSEALTASSDLLYNLGKIELLTASCSLCDADLQIAINLAREAVLVLVSMVSPPKATALRELGLALDGVFTAAYGTAGGVMLLNYPIALRRLRDDIDAMGLFGSPTDDPSADSAVVSTQGGGSEFLAGSGGSGPGRLSLPTMVRQVAEEDRLTIGADSRLTLIMISGDPIAVRLNGEPLEADPLKPIAVDSIDGQTVIIGATSELAGLELALGADSTIDYVVDLGGDATRRVGLRPVPDGGRVVFNPATDEPFTTVDSTVVADDEIGTDEDFSVIISPLSNDTFVGGVDPDSFVVTVDGTTGTLDQDGTDLTYTPAADWFGTDTFTYEACDVGGECAEATVTVEVTPVNDAPVADDDEATTDRGQAVAVEVLVNDTDVETLDGATVTIAETPATGTADVDASGVVTYTPSETAAESDGFIYELCDSEGLCDTATVTVTIGGGDGPPVAVDDTAATDEDVAVTVEVLANDSDPDDDLDPSTITLTASPISGGAEVGEDGTVLYTPDTNTNGTDTFTYRVCDATEQCDSAEVTIEVRAVNDPPEALDDSATTAEDTPITVAVLENDTDTDGDELAVVSVDGATNGTATIVDAVAIRYEPESGWCGSENLIYEAADPEGAKAAAALAIEVECVNDPPTAGDDTFATDEDVTLTITAPGLLANDTDPEGAAVTVVDHTTPEEGTLSVGEDGSVEYQAPVDWYGTVTFEYTVADPSGATASAVAEITVRSVNDPPEVRIGSTTPVQHSDQIPLVTITATDVDDETVELALTSVDDGLDLRIGPISCETTADGGATCTATVNGTASGPAGVAGFTVVVSDFAGMAASAVATVDIEAEEAALTYADNNPTAVEVAEAGGTSGEVTIGLSVVELAPDSAPGTPQPGDIGQARVAVRLSPVGPGSSIPGTCVTGPVDGAGYDAVGSISCTFDGLPVNVYTIEAVVNGGYYTASAENVLTVYDTSLGFTTGGGWFYWPGSADPDNNYPGDRTNFGYTMSYNRKGTNLKGNLLVIRHLPDGTIYRIKSNALSGGLALGSETEFGWASFTGKATYREPGWDDAVGNHHFTAYAEDRADGTDRFWLKVTDKDGSPVTLSMVEPGPENATGLEGGGVIAHDENRGGGGAKTGRGRGN